MDSGNKQPDLFEDAPVWWEGLTYREQLFVEYYCGDRECFLNAAASYVKAFGKKNKELSESSIKSNPSRIMRNSKIKTAINKLLRARQNEEDRLSEFQVLRLLKTLSFYNPADILDKNGNITKELGELGELALCVQEIKRNSRGDRVYKLYDRTRALEMLSRYLDLIRPAEGTLVVNPYMYLSEKDTAEMRADYERAAAARLPVQDAEFEVIPREEA